MPLQPPDFVGNLDPNDPRDTDSRTISDDYHRMIQESCRMTTPNYTGEVTATHEDTNLLSGYTANGVKPMPGEGGVTTLFHYGTTAPTGWTITEPDTNLRELIIGPAAGGGTIGGSIDPTNLTDTVSVSISGSTAGGGAFSSLSIFGTGTNNGPNVTVQPAFTATEVPRSSFTTNVTGSTSGVGDHTHGAGSLSGSGNVQISPRYARGLLMQLEV